MSVKCLCSYPSIHLIVDSLKKNLKTSFYVSTILNNKPEIENKKTDTCKYFSKKRFSRIFIRNFSVLP